MKKMIKLLSVLVLLVALVAVCLGEENHVTVRVATLKGPTGMGMAHMMAQNDGAYAFTLAGAPEEVSAMLINGSVDIAAVPINLGAVLYNKTKGEVKQLALITRGMLYVMEKGESIQSVADLAGKTVVMAGQGATPDYLLSYILKVNGTQNVTIDYRSEHAEVITLAASGMADIILVPEPNVTSLLMKDASFRVALDLTEEFNRAAAQDGHEDAVLSMSAVVVRDEFLQKHPDLVAAFMRDLEASILFTEQDVETAAKEIAEAGILPSAAIAQKALPLCRLTYQDGADVQAQVEPLFQILLEANPASIGGALPDVNFYYVEK